MRLRGFLLGVGLITLVGCATSPPRNVENACYIFQEKPDWFDASVDVEKRYGLPIQVQLAIIRQESSFKHNAKPARDTLLGIPMWWRVSSAYGYAQVLDGTWDWYKDKTGRWFASRENYADAVDFMGWYTNISQRTLGISKWDAYNQYLAYHEGHGGWKRKTFNKKQWLIEVAKKVDRNAQMYGTQLKNCKSSLGSSSWWWPF